MLTQKTAAMQGTAIFENASATLRDIGDGVLALEFHSKGNTLDGDTLTAAERAFEIVPQQYRGLVIANDGPHFSFGANLRWLLSLLDRIGSDRAEFQKVAKRFQRITTGMRTVTFPTVCAPFNLTIGGALELSMYADAVVAHESMRASLPEVAVGILPDLGGTSELYARCAEAAGPIAGLRQAFETIVYMRASADAASARPLHFLRETDEIVAQRDELLSRAKARVLDLAASYKTPGHRREIPVLGDQGYAALDAAIGAAVSAEHASPYDAEIARAIARVMTGGPGPARAVDHEELLDLETQYFEGLVFDPRTRARMEHMLETGTPLRN